MKRKVIKQGNNTLTITLPRNWTQKYSVKAGDEIEIDNKDGNLIICPYKNSTEEIIKLNLSNLSFNNLRHFFSTFYRIGYDNIQISFDKPYEFLSVQEEVDKFMGFEVVSNTKNSCKIKSVATLNEKEFDSMFRKSHQIVLLLFDLLKEDLKKEKYIHKELVNKYRYKNLTLTDYCRRILNKKGLFDDKIDKSVYMLVVKINYICSVLKDIFAYLENKSYSIDKKVYSFLLEVENMYKLTMEGYFKGDIKLVDEGINIKKKIYNDRGIKLLEKTKGKDTVVLTKLYEMVKHIYALHSPIFTIFYKNNIITLEKNGNTKT